MLDTNAEHAKTLKLSGFDISKVKDPTNLVMIYEYEVRDAVGVSPKEFGIKKEDEFVTIGIPAANISRYRVVVTRYSYYQNQIAEQRVFVGEWSSF